MSSVTLPSEPSYDAISQEYRDSKQLAFRTFVEAYTLDKLLGDIRGLEILDLACGEGIYSRKLRQAGASRVVGADLSPNMIELAREAEASDPLGCEYLVGDASTLGKVGTFDLVLGSYLLNYASSKKVARGFAETIHANLKSGGRFVGMNDNPAQDPARYTACERYGFRKSTPANRSEGDPITYTIRNPDGTTFQFDNYYLHPKTIETAFVESNFVRFDWEGPWLSSESAQHFPPGFWDDFMIDPPIIGIEARRD